MTGPEREGGRGAMRSAKQCQDMLRIAQVQEKVSRAPDYWSGVIDGLGYSLGELPDALQAHLMVDKATREHMRSWAAGEYTHPGEAEEPS